ncbi:Aste57867_14565 [Aphanomyces stellatus]|uniref:Aste57867_14565 protein n=1 Tax=Aphanomyces stellatus TaxID=120398 RepID=A0A485L1B5_9STRA|nr:hypothetical protein As57867_014511 [Aphanomyces stellatus]VFT91385.1 Aste57867_14565 [Aphanomyces stellatus]
MFVDVILTTTQTIPESMWSKHSEQQRCFGIEFIDRVQLVFIIPSHKQCLHLICSGKKHHYISDFTGYVNTKVSFIQTPEKITLILQSAMKLTLVVANKHYSTWPLRAWALMTHLGIDFEEHVAPLDDLQPGVNLREPWVSLSPTRRFPLLLIDYDPTSTAAPFLIWDSLAIMEFLYETHVAVWPADARARAFARSAAAEMHSGFEAVRDVCTGALGLRVELHPAKKNDPAFQADLTRLSKLIRQGLDTFGGPFLAGPAFTAADAMYCPVAFRVQTYRIVFDDAAVNAYFERLRGLDAMRQWEQAGLVEPYRLLKYDEHARQVGTVVEDLRRSA